MIRRSASCQIRTTDRFRPRAGALPCAGAAGVVGPRLVRLPQRYTCGARSAISRRTFAGAAAKGASSSGAVGRRGAIVRRGRSFVAARFAPCPGLPLFVRRAGRRAWRNETPGLPGNMCGTSDRFSAGETVSKRVVPKSTFGVLKQDSWSGAHRCEGSQACRRFGGAASLKPLVAAPRSRALRPFGRRYTARTRLIVPPRLKS